jgi:hypothetical protein
MNKFHNLLRGHVLSPLPLPNALNLRQQHSVHTSLNLSHNRPLPLNVPTNLSHSLLLPLNVLISHSLNLSQHNVLISHNQPPLLSPAPHKRNVPTSLLRLSAPTSQIQMSTSKTKVFSFQLPALPP